MRYEKDAKITNNIYNSDDYHTNWLVKNQIYRKMAISIAIICHNNIIILSFLFGIKSDKILLLLVWNS